MALIGAYLGVSMNFLTEVPCAMSRAAKTLEQMRTNPMDWRIADLETVARAFGVNVRRSGGSHVVFEHPGVVEALSVPSRRPIKPLYVRRFVGLVDAALTIRDKSDD